jgi:hypothetical protein
MTAGGACFVCLFVGGGEAEFDHFRDHFMFEFCRGESNVRGAVGFVIESVGIIVVHRVVGVWIDEDVVVMVGAVSGTGGYTRNP